MNSETTASVSRGQNLGPNGAQLPSWEFPPVAGQKNPDSRHRQESIQTPLACTIALSLTRIGSGAFKQISEQS